MWDFIVSALETILKYTVIISIVSSVLGSIFVNKTLWRLIYAIPSYAAFIFLIFLPLLLLGYIMIPLAAICGAYEWHIDEHKKDKGQNPNVFHFTWRIMKVWDNWEDGIANTMYKEYDSLFKQIMYWSAFRNPVNNLRIIPLLSLDIDPSKVNWIGGPHMMNTAYDKKPARPEWFFAWHGFYSNLWIQFSFRGKVYRFWQGWKIFPEDVFGVKGHRVRGAGFAQQLKRLD